MKKRILICDDSSTIRAIIKKELQDYYDLEIFDDGIYAYDFLLKDQRFDFAIIDGEMPQMGGFELLRRIKEELNLIFLPVVILTANEGDYYEKQAFNLGAFDFLKKPFKQGQLLRYLLDYFNEELTEGSVLVIEDSTIQNETICQQLRLKNMQPISANNAVEAMRYLLSGIDIDVILMDIFLPQYTGYDLISILKSDERFSFIPIVGLTAFKEKDILSEILNLGADDFIYKPYNINEFFSRVRANIRISKLIKKLKQTSEEDYLTGIYNRRTFFHFLENLTALSVRENKPLSFVILDIDYFKKINDTYGHDIGDSVLKKLAEIVLKMTRRADVFGRYGGEEFCLALPNTDLYGACLLANKIRSTISQTIMTFNKYKTISFSITISAGVAEFTKGMEIDTLVKIADKNLYLAKENGRNRVYPILESVTKKSI
ncbi:two-component system, cell cycle response regulator [Desulfurella multipotens]|uniref:diguanylate cyclase n=2 Tax=Desulfurella TaxID=33001 RepID=A0A1G6JNK8_9BACT|nr:diguanylate cyclase [Desulfurella multipotens]SDC20342.1 two-component system, cell cycle response regulator [Desulfurella multipotens]